MSALDPDFGTRQGIARPPAEPTPGGWRTWARVGLVAALIAGGGVVAWMGYESPYDYCKRIVYEDLAGVTAGRRGSITREAEVPDEVRVGWRRTAVETCDYLQQRDRLGEVNSDNAHRLWLEATGNQPAR